MRARGAACTDVAVLVVAADDGVMPQTREALAHARAAGCPIVVAVTKCDKEAARPEEVRRQLVAEGLELEEAGGSVQAVEVSAVSGRGLDTLSEALLLEADQLDLRVHRWVAPCRLPTPTHTHTRIRPAHCQRAPAHRARPLSRASFLLTMHAPVSPQPATTRRRTGDAEGVVLESKVDKGQGALITVLLRKGSLSVGAGPRG